MDKRTALPKGYMLTVKNSSNGEQIYKIKSEIARGGSCIVYDATYVNNSGTERLVRIKECYPFKLNISRDFDGKLCVREDEIPAFDEYKKRLKMAFDSMNELFGNVQLTNSTSNTYDIYVENNTVYIVSVYVQGDTLSNRRGMSLKDSISVVRTVARVLREMHKSGYLYLDIKPDNVWVFKETPDLIQLFDFDSLWSISVEDDTEDLEEYRLSFTKGFAAYELQMRQMDKIGMHTDVYGIGALLFYLVFGHAPSMLDRDIYASYDYSKSLYADKRFQDKFYFKLTEYFHNTLSDYYADRYRDMDEVLEVLEELVELADEKRIFIYSTNLAYEKKVFGRDVELNKLALWLQDESKREIYVTGIGGIGKSSVVRTFLSSNQDKIDSCVYLDYMGDIKRTIISDMQLAINGIERYDGEEEQEYFARKLSALREIAQKEKVLLVIDNYMGEDCKELRSLLDVNCRVIFITRRELAYGDCEINLKAVAEIENAYNIFEYYIGKKLEENEISYVQELIEAISGHTLVLELIAKQILSSHLTIEEAAVLVKENGFTKIGQEKIRFSKDNTGVYETLSNIIGAIFDSSTMNEDKRALLKAVALFGTSGIAIKEFSELLGINNTDSINELHYDGWIEVQNGRLTVHPVICEVIHSWREDQTVDKYVLEIMNRIFKVIRLENHKEDYSKKLLQLHQVMQESYERNKWLKKLYDKHMTKQGVIGDVIAARIERGEDYSISNHDLMNKILFFAENIIMYCDRDETLRSTNIYKDMLYETVIAMPRDREEFVLARSEALIADKTVSNSITMMKLFDYRVCIFCERMDFESAWIEIERAKNFLNRHRCNYAIGQYYETLAEIYDSMLEGAYEAVTDEEYENLDALIDSLNKAIKYTKKSNSSYRKELQLIKCMLSKTNVLIRSGSGSIKEIDKLLDTIQSLIFTHCQANSAYVKDYYMTCAWYATRIAQSYKHAGEFAMKAAQISVKTATSEMQFVDEIIIPYANMLLELNHHNDAIKWLDDGIKMCEDFLNVVPYIRKRMCLQSYKVDVYFCAKEYDNCKDAISIFDELAERYRDCCEIEVEISDDIREEVLANITK